MSRGSVVILIVSVLAAIWAVAMMTPPGRVGYLYFFMYADFYMGVLTLVSLSITIMVGLVSTDRLVLSIRQRVLLQSVHRTTGVIAIVSLVVHVWTKVIDKTIGVVDIFIPFLADFKGLYIGFGTISGWVMVLVMWTGIARSRFIGMGKPWMWRAIHAVSYLIWPIAIVHGLSAGRPAKAWVVVSYIVCVLAVLVGLAVRLTVSLNRRKDFSSSAGVGGMKPVGKLVPTASPAAKRPGRRQPERVSAEPLAPVAVVDTFQPVMAPPVADPMLADPMMADPMMAEPAPRVTFDEPTGAIARRDLDFEPEERPRSRRRADEEIEYEEPAPRGRRYAEDDTLTWTRGEGRGRRDLEDTGGWSRREMEDTGARMRRPDLEDTSARMRRSDLEETGARMRRPDLEDTGGWSRREMGDFDEPAPRRRARYADDEEPAPRSRRRAAAEPIYDDAPRSRRGGTGEYDEVPRQRGPRYADDEPVGRRAARYEPRYGGEAEEAPRARRDRGADLDRADSGRHSRSGFVDLAEDDAAYVAPDETPTLVDMASRRARRAQQQDSGRGQAGRGARRGGRGRGYDEGADEAYFSQLRGEAN